MRYISQLIILRQLSTLLHQYVLIYDDIDYGSDLDTVETFLNEGQLVFISVKLSWSNTTKV